MGSFVAQVPEGFLACRNCGTRVVGRYCPDCGQETTLHPLSVVEFAREIASHYVAADGKVWRTFALLLFRPGRLTAEYLAGRRGRYIAPVRLFLTASFLFFSVAQINSQYMKAHLASDGAAAPAGKSPDTGFPVLVIARDDLEWIQKEQFADCVNPGARCAWWKRWLAPAMIKLQAEPQAFVDRFAERFQHALSYAVFLLLPIFAWLLTMAYRNRRMFYGEHLIFALHVHSFWFVLALIAIPLPNAIGNVLWWVCVGYCLLALRRVYAGRWPFMLLRAGAIAAAYFTTVGLGAALLSALVFST